MLRFNRSLPTAAILALIAVGCASNPKQVQSIEDARQAIRQVESSPLAGEVAAQEIDSAHTALRQAETLARKRKSAEQVSNAAYVAKRHAQIAQEQIAAAQAKKDIERAETDRQAVLLQAREREARIKEQQADRAKQEADLATQAALNAANQATQQANQATLQADQERQRAEQLERELKDLNAKKTDRGYVLTLGDVLFDTGHATLKPGAMSSIERLAAFLKEAPDRSVTIEGHTDSVGSESYNQELSQRRAEAVREALLGRGVPRDRIVAVGKGKSFPVASNDSAGGRQQNRRVEIIFDSPQRTSSINAR